jgi:PsbP-like protein
MFYDSIPGGYRLDNYGGGRKNSSNNPFFAAGIVQHQFIKMVKIFSSFFAAFLFAATIQAQQTTPPLPEIWKVFADSSLSIQYPASWEVKTNLASGIRFVILSPLAENNDAFRENVNLLIQDLKGYNVDLDKYVEVTEGQVKTLLPNGQLLESTRMKSDAGEWHKFMYLGSQGGNPLKFEQYCWVIGEKAYVLTLTCETGQFENYRKTGERILNSFKLDNTTKE